MRRFVGWHSRLFTSGPVGAGTPPAAEGSATEAAAPLTGGSVKLRLTRRAVPDKHSPGSKKGRVSRPGPGNEIGASQRDRLLAHQTVEGLRIRPLRDGDAKGPAWDRVGLDRLPNDGSDQARCLLSHDHASTILAGADGELPSDGAFDA